MVGLLDVLEARNHERDKLRKECGLEIFGDACPVVWLGKPEVVVALNHTN